MGVAQEHNTVTVTITVMVMVMASAVAVVWVATVLGAAGARLVVEGPKALAHQVEPAATARGPQGQ